MNTNHSHIILFDGVCNFCNSLVNFIIKRDSTAKFKFIPLQSEKGKLLLAKYNLPSGLNSFVYIKNNICFTHSTAALQAVRELDGFWKWAYVFIVIPKPIRDNFYRFFARYRYKLFGKKDSCMIPTPDIMERFDQ